MTVISTSSKVVDVGNGSNKDFNFNFLIPASGDEVIIFTDLTGVSTTLSNTTYTVTGFNNPAGGSVHYPNVGSAIAAGTTLTIARILPLTQEVSFSNQGAVYLGVTESTFDNTVLQIQQIAEAESRNLVAPITDPNTPLPIPSAAARANQLLGFDASGNPIAISTAPAGVISSAMAPVVAAASIAAADTLLGLGSSSNVVFNQVTVGPGATFMNSSGDITMSGSLIVAGFSTFDKLAVISAGTSVANAEWLRLLPTDFGLGRPYLYAKKLNTATSYEIGLFDGVTNTGTLNLSVSALTHNGNPVLSNNITVTRLTTGSGTYTPPAGTGLLRVRMVGGGGGAGAAITNNGTNGGNTALGSWIAAGGSAGLAGSIGGAGGTGGGDGTGTRIVRFPGASGNPGNAGTAIDNGGIGASSLFGGGAVATLNGSGGNNAVANTGSGGSGGIQTSTGVGGGGGAGEYVEFFVFLPGSLAYSVGAPGTGGAAGTRAGGNGAAGIIIIEEYH